MDTNDLHAVAFPRLDAGQLAVLERCAGAVRRRFRDGEALVRAGDRDAGFFVVLAGELAIVDESEETQKSIAVLGEGEFTGEVAQLTGAPSLVTVVARGDCEVYAVSPDGVRQVVTRSTDLSDVMLQAFIARRQLLRESGAFTGVRVIGSRHSRETFRIREFLARSRVPFTWLDLESDPQVRNLLPQFGVTEEETPLVAWGRRFVLRNPSNRELAEALGLRSPLASTVYDLVIVGAGPAGLAAAVYGASEGLNTVVLERTAPGGQASRSMRIENYLGFPTGIPGSELADRAFVQAAKFGASVPLSTLVTRLSFDNVYGVLHLDGGETVTGKCVLIATGVDYRQLEAEGRERFEGCGVYYAATLVEAPACRGAAAVVVGGGNSAGQAAVFLSGQARKVFLVVRGDSLYKDMSSYLARRVEQTENIEVLLRTTVQRMDGDECLREVELHNHATGETRTVATPALFSFIGAVPRSEWLPPEIERDAKGFVRTGAALARSAAWSAPRSPGMFETSRPGVFAAGDVRADSIKRVAAAVGEGSMVVRFVHDRLGEL